MQVSINAAFLPGVDEACEMYCWILHILHFASNLREVKTKLESLSAVEKDCINRHFLITSDDTGMHFFQRKYSDSNKYFDKELFTISATNM